MGRSAILWFRDVTHLWRDPPYPSGLLSVFRVLPCLGTGVYLSWVTLPSSLWWSSSYTDPLPAGAWMVTRPWPLFFETALTSFVLMGTGLCTSLNCYSLVHSLVYSLPSLGTVGASQAVVVLFVRTLGAFHSAGCSKWPDLTPPSTPDPWCVTLKNRHLLLLLQLAVWTHCLTVVSIRCVVSHRCTVTLRLTLCVDEDNKLGPQAVKFTGSRSALPQSIFTIITSSASSTQERRI